MNNKTSATNTRKLSKYDTCWVVASIGIYIYILRPGSGSGNKSTALEPETSQARYGKTEAQEAPSSFWPINYILRWGEELISVRGVFEPGRIQSGDGNNEKNTSKSPAKLHSI